MQKQWFLVTKISQKTCQNRRFWTKKQLKT